jgi:hypothetical protein
VKREVAGLPRCLDAKLRKVIAIKLTVTNSTAAAALGPFIRAASIVPRAVNAATVA